MTGRRLLASLVALCAAATGLYNQYGLLRPEIISDAYLKADEAKCLRGAEHTPTREDKMTTEKPLAAVMDANKKWAEGISAKDPSYFEQLATGQSPDYLWIGCSDSRIPPNTLLNLPPGAVFVHRNIGNLFGLKDLSSMAVVEYAVSHLKVKHVILCGHTSCGAVAGSLKFPPEAPGTVNLWISDLKARLPMPWHRLAQLSVKRSVYNLVNSPPVMGAWKGGEPLTVHGMLFRIETGLLEEVVTVNSAEEASSFEY